MGREEQVWEALPGRAPGLLLGEVCARLGETGLTEAEVAAVLERLGGQRRVVRYRSRTARRLGGQARFYRSGAPRVEGSVSLPAPLF